MRTARIARMLERNLTHTIALWTKGAGTDPDPRTGLPTSVQPDTIIYAGRAFFDSHEVEQASFRSNIRLEGDATVRLPHGIIPADFDTDAVFGVGVIDGIERDLKVNTWRRMSAADYLGVTFSGPGRPA